jgi:hypothetical protein
MLLPLLLLPTSPAMVFCLRPTRYREATGSGVKGGGELITLAGHQDATNLLQAIPSCNPHCKGASALNSGSCLVCRLD